MSSLLLQRIPPLRFLLDLARIEGFQPFIPFEKVQDKAFPISDGSSQEAIFSLAKNFFLVWCSPEGSPQIAFQHYLSRPSPPPLAKEVIRVMIAPMDREEEAFQGYPDAEQWFFLPEEYLVALYQQSLAYDGGIGSPSPLFSDLFRLPPLPMARREIGIVVENNFFPSASGDLCLLTIKAPPLARRAYPGRFFTLSVSPRAFAPGYEVVDDCKELAEHYPCLFSEDSRISRVPLNPLKTLRSLSFSREGLSFYGGGGNHPSSQLLLPPLLSALVRPALPELLTFGIKVVGERTRLLARKQKGVEVDLLGPLGSPVPFYREAQHILLVGGGIGIPPLYPVAEVYIRAGKKVTLLAGGRTRDQLYPKGKFLYPEFEQIGVQTMLCIEEEGEPFVTDRMAEYLESLEGEGVDVIYSCGPGLMMAKVAQIAEKFHRLCYVFLESRMECGTGVCMSCVVPLRQGEGWRYGRVCREGPVFDTRVIDWERFCA